MTRRQSRNPESMPHRSSHAAAPARNNLAGLSTTLLPVVLLTGLLASFSGCSHLDSPEYLASRAVTAEVFPTIQYAADDFYYRSATAFTPRYSEQNRLYTGQAAHLIVTASNYALDHANKVNLTYALNIIDPRGVLHEGPLNIPLYQGQVPNPDLQLFPQDRIVFYAGQGDPAGEYTLQIILSDNVSGVQRELKQKLQVRPYQIPQLPADFNPVTWLEHYYLNPTPEFALPALALFEPIATTPTAQVPTAIAAPSATPYADAPQRLLGFYEQILADNPWLLPHFITRYEHDKIADARYARSPAHTRERLKQILTIHSRRYSERPEQIPPHLWRELRHADRKASGENSRPVTVAKREQLWGRFFASGAFVHISQLAATAADHHFLDADAAQAQARFARLSERHGPEQALAELVPTLHPHTQALIHSLWSLHQRGQEHTLVRAYLRHITDNGGDRLDARTLELLQSVAERQSLIASGLPAMDIRPDPAYEALRKADGKSGLRPNPHSG